MKHYHKNSEMQFEMLNEGEREKLSKIFFVTCSGTKLHLQRPNGLQGINFSSDYFLSFLSYQNLKETLIKKKTHFKFVPFVPTGQNFILSQDKFNVEINMCKHFKSRT